MMQTIKFECTLLTDLVLSAEAATEGFHKSLDYIPGAKFLGIASKTLYHETQPAQTLDLFHNGMVCFGDAHRIGTTAGPTYRIPYSWYAPKGGNLDEVYLHHEMTEVMRQELRQAGKQLETAKPGYFNKHGEVIGDDQLFSIKSAYDSEKYRAKDENMYGYFALKSGSRWQFEVETDNTAYIPLIEKALVGKQRIGRSSSAEYGLIEIEKTGIEAMPTPQPIAPSLVYLYAVSNWCFYDEAQRNTTQPDPVKHLLLPAGSQIVWEKSQLRTRVYKNWNRHRNNRDADRTIIEKGSVLAVQLGGELDPGVLAQGVGAHRAEGFGKVLVNPLFLYGQAAKLTLILKKDDETTDRPQAYYAVEQATEDVLLLQILNKKAGGGSSDRAINDLINQFIRVHGDRFKGLTNSQWGQIRTMAKYTDNAVEFRKLTFNDPLGACYKGKSESVWRQNDRRVTLETFLFTDSGLQGEGIVALAIKLSAEMAKRSN